MADTSFDVLIIGAGPGGYVTAIRAAQLGFKTAIVEREHLGGICLNWGCIPTKALLRSAEIYHYMKHADAYGLSAKDVSFDPAKVVQRSRGVSGRLTVGVNGLLKKNKVQIIWGEAKVTKPGEVVVTDMKKPAVQPQNPPPKGTLGAGTYSAKHIIIATGARPRVLPGLEHDGKLVWSYFEAMVPQEMPSDLLVVGSGAIGIEFASFYNAMGVNVTVVEIMDQIMPVEDTEISKMAQKLLEKQGIQFRISAKVAKLEKGKDSVKATIEAGGKSETITVDRVIAATGVVGNIENLGLEALGVKTEKGCVAIDGYGRTNIPGIYAIGDVAGPPMLAHKAEHEGVICIEKIKGLDAHPMKKEQIPGCTYCHPQVASVGLTEAKAKAAGFELKIGRFPFLANGKAIALGEDQGLIKTIFDAKTGRLLGAHMVGAEVTELIQGFVVAMGLETTEEELMHTVFPHPTLSEMMHESVLDAYGRVIHM
jgi:dihydrolipoamide dehydrogenase